MKTMLVAAIMLLLALAGCVSPAPDGALRIITEENPPFNFTDETGCITGQSTAIIRLLAEKVGAKARIEIMPWADGYSLAQHNANVVLYSTVRTPSREKLFKWVGPIGFDDDWFYSKRGADITLNSLEDAKNVKSIAVYRDDRNHLYLAEKGFGNLDISENDVDCIRKLANGSVDLWLGPSGGFHFIAYKAGVNPAELQPVKLEKRTEYYIAFNNKTADSVIESWQSALDGMKSSPDNKTMSAYERIITSYALPQYSSSPVTRARVIQLVDDTVRDIEADATGTVSKINSRSAPYLDTVYPELYIYIYDNSCTEVANASNPSLKGRCFKGVPDIAGRLFRDNIVDGALTDGSGWEDYVFTMPGNIGIFYKSAYYKLALGSDGKQYIVCSGLYKSAPDE